MSDVFRNIGLALIRSRAAAPTETAEAATARRAEEFRRLTEPDPALIAETAAAILEAGRIARGEVHLDRAPPQPPQPRPALTQDEATRLAAEIVRCAARARGETT
jgi:hypothetical protein